jgi:hypothetical protein
MPMAQDCSRSHIGPSCKLSAVGYGKCLPDRDCPAVQMLERSARDSQQSNVQLGWFADPKRAAWLSAPSAAGLTLKKYQFLSFHLVPFQASTSDSLLLHGLRVRCPWETWRRPQGFCSGSSTPIPWAASMCPGGPWGWYFPMTLRGNRMCSRCRERLSKSLERSGRGFGMSDILAPLLLQVADRAVP